MLVRPFRPNDAEALSRIFYSAVHGLTRRDYSDAQRHAWAPILPVSSSIVARAADGRVLLVAVDESDAPLAYGDLESNGHIDHLYRHPDAASAGVASAVYERLEAEARVRGMGSLTVEASETARRFFLRRGFRVAERREFVLRGVPIHNYAMVKPLGRGLSSFQ